jgi:hypothetical protein
MLQSSVMALLFLITYFSHAQAGVDSSGGGSAVVCRNASNGIIVSAELLDLYEAKNLLGLTINAIETPYLEQALRVTQIIGKGNAFDGAIEHVLSDSVQKIQSSMRILPPGVGLTPIHDFQSIILPKNCSIIQLARYELNETVTVDGDIWNALNNTNRAALLVHEALYRLTRSLGETTSDGTRIAVGKAFAGVQFESVLAGVSEEIVECTDQPKEGEIGRWYFLAYRNSNEGVTLQFLAVNGHFMLSKAAANLGPDTWPFPITKSRTDAFISLDSVLDGGTPIRLRIEQTRAGSTRSYIDVSQRFDSPKTEIFCK